MTQSLRQPVNPVSSTSLEHNLCQVSGIGLVTGLPVDVIVKRARPGQGIHFLLDDAACDSVGGSDSAVRLPAMLNSVVNAELGVTLGRVGADGKPQSKMLAIVEHFLSACSLAGLNDLDVTVKGEDASPLWELPILDGSAKQWLNAFESAGMFSSGASVEGVPVVNASVELPETVFYQHNETILLRIEPAEHFKLTYNVDFPHPGLEKVQSHWDSKTDSIASIADARTFGFVRELPELQKRGLARGVSEENTLGLTDEGGYTKPLRFELEPVRHKMLDLIGDLTLMGLNPLSLKGHVYAVNAGHASHIGLAKKIVEMLTDGK